MPGKPLLLEVDQRTDVSPLDLGARGVTSDVQGELEEAREAVVRDADKLIAERNV